MEQNISDAQSIGFRILGKRQQVKLALDASGHEGMISLAQALMKSGKCETEEIVAEVVSITGDHAEKLIRMILMEGENIHWCKDWDGNHTAISSGQH